MFHLLSRGIAVRDGKILLAHYVEKGYWFLPGGHIESGESGAAALMRESEEEMALAIGAPSLLTTFEHAYEDKREIQHELTLVYAYEAPEGEVVSRVPHLEFAWVSREQFDTSIKFLPKALRAPISAYLEGTPMPVFISTLESGAVQA